MCAVHWVVTTALTGFLFVPLLTELSAGGRAPFHWQHRRTQRVLVFASLSKSLFVFGCGWAYLDTATKGGCARCGFAALRNAPPKTPCPRGIPGAGSRTSPWAKTVAYPGAVIREVVAKPLTHH